MNVGQLPEFRHLPRVPTDASVRNRFRGCLLGGAVGDALGAPVEFMHLDAIRKQFGTEGIRDMAPAYGKLGAVTDDTQMTLFTAEGMLRAQVRTLMRGFGPVFPSVTANAYLRWLMTQGYRCDAMPEERPIGWLIGHRELFNQRAPGNTCIAALREMKRPGDPADNDSKGCGGVMRVAPVGMFLARWASDTSDEMTTRAFDIACSLAAITHGHPTGQLSAGVLAAVIALVLNGAPLPAAIDRAKAQLCLRPRHWETLIAIERAQLLSQREPNQPDSICKLGEGWVAEEALGISLYCALCATDFEKGIVLAVNHSGDSDSTGSMTGNLLGVDFRLELTRRFHSNLTRLIVA